MEINQSGQQTEKQILKNERNVQDILDIIKHPNWHITVVPEGEERENGIKEVFEEFMAENSPNLKTGNRYSCNMYSNHRGPPKKWTETDLYLDIL